MWGDRLEDAQRRLKRNHRSSLGKRPTLDRSMMWVVHRRRRPRSGIHTKSRIGVLNLSRKYQILRKSRRKHKRNNLMHRWKTSIGVAPSGKEGECPASPGNAQPPAKCQEARKGHLLYSNITDGASLPAATCLT